MFKNYFSVQQAFLQFIKSEVEVENMEAISGILNFISVACNETGKLSKFHLTEIFALSGMMDWRCNWIFCFNPLKTRQCRNGPIFPIQFLTIRIFCRVEKRKKKKFSKIGLEFFYAKSFFWVFSSSKFLAGLFLFFPLLALPFTIFSESNSLEQLKAHLEGRVFIKCQKFNVWLPT